MDIYVLNYIDTLIFERDASGEIIGFDHQCIPNMLYLNNGDFTFSEMTAAYQASGHGCALAVAPVFLDNGNRGIYLANDFGEYLHPNEFLWFNEDTNTFEEQAATMGLDQAMFGMGIAVGDIDGDLDLDYYVTNMGKNVLMENVDGKYVDRADVDGVDDTFANEIERTTGWGTFFL